MDNITTKTIIIAISIFVTLIVVSLVILTFSQMKKIYGIVNKTDNSIYTTFDNVHMMYNGKIENGMGLLNTLKKYENEVGSPKIIVSYINKEEIILRAATERKREAQYLKEIMEKNESGEITQINGTIYRYQDKYRIDVSKDNDLNVILSFERLS